MGLDYESEKDCVRFKDFVRDLRGHSCSKLILCCDDKHYVAKTLDNPRGRRTLANEWVVARLFQFLGIGTPNIRIVLAGEANDESSGDSCSESDNRLVAGLHFGSQVPVNPNVSAIYDFLPAKLYERLSNRGDFLRVFILDTLMGKPDPRQAIFYRPPHAGRDGLYVAEFIDHGECFETPPCPVPDPCYYFDRRVYRDRVSLSSVNAFLDRIFSLELDRLMSFFEEIPAEWLAPADREKFRSRFLTMLRRRSVLSASTVCDLLSTRALPARRTSSVQLRGPSAEVCSGATKNLGLACVPETNREVCEEHTYSTTELRCLVPFPALTV